MIILILVAVLGYYTLIDNSGLLLGVAKVIDFIGYLFDVVMTPLNNMITTTMPDVQNGIQAINDMLDYALTYMGWILDATLIPELSIALIVGYYTFAFGLTFAAWGLKLILDWYKVIVK